MRSFFLLSATAFTAGYKRRFALVAAERDFTRVSASSAGLILASSSGRGITIHAADDAIRGDGRRSPQPDGRQLTHLGLKDHGAQGKNKKSNVLRLPAISQLKVRMRQLVWQDAIEDVVKHSHEKAVIRRLQKLLVA